MSVYKRGKIWWYKFSWNGEPIRESTKQSNKRIAEQMEAAKRTALAKAEVGIKKRERAPKLAEFAPRFTAAIETTCAEKPATVSFYKAKLKVLVKHLGGQRLDEIEEAEIEQYVQTRANTRSRRNRLLAPASVNRELATLRRLLRLAQEWKILDRVPRVHLLRGEHQREFVLDHQQETLFFAAADAYSDLRDVAALLIDTGLRIRECLTLEWTDVRLEPAERAKHGYLTIRRRNAKNSKSRNVPLTARAVEVLRRRIPASAGLVFRHADGRPLYQTWLNQQHAALRILLKMPADFVLHSFRHTFGTRLGETGADAFTIMRLMGHSTVTVS
jgi:integrase